jgi:cytochrome b561
MVGKMQLTNSKAQYGAAPQILHWLTALFVICGWLLGTFLDDLPKGSVRSLGLVVHMTLGQFVVVFLIVRLIWRMTNPPPPPEPTRFGWLQQAIAAFTHYVLYALLVAVPFMGILVQLKRGHALPLFGIWDLNSPWPVDRAMAKGLLQVHEYLADALLLLAGFHAAAALIHHYLFEDRTLLRMLPGVSSPVRRRAKARSTPPVSP